ncbi:sphingomyelin phosphodiesterase [Talaromyces proteolyticus]|uniref:Sphingomyelin phosphodiesterase n=1 Tax=Talaromyces proteolyticus TaxID=1131652 RepID=A0AAD4KEC4_9EURO|nr:sphingomyelin phosphodiesterase [Talaromyces proteolyticus]KAH8689040.1 sphingomyelin phosphodiesterase [Talaromyces proteolyticus]
MYCRCSLLLAVLSSCISQLASARSSGSQVLAYTVPADFPTSLFPSYYVPPSPTQQPQPIIHDTALNYTYPLALTDPYNIPQEDDDRIYYPAPLYNVSNGSAIAAHAIKQVQSIIAGSGSNCTKCISALKVGQYVAQRVPSVLPDLLVRLCQSTNFSSNTTCQQNYEATTFGAVWTQVLALADVARLDGQYICNSISSSFCPMPSTLPSNTTGYFGPKPAHVKVTKPSGKRVKVLHMSDLHIGPRYAVGAEASCSRGPCCRANVGSTSGKIALPAALYGSFKCDSPYFLLTSALESLAPLTGTSHKNHSHGEQFAWTIYTGDVVSHDSQNQLSRNYTMYSEWSIYHMLKAYIPSGPIFPVLGNHDSNPEAIDAPHSLPGNLGQQQSWNYDHVASLWQQNNWITPAAANEARMHYAAYSINHPAYPKLRIITLNTDFFYKSNFFNYINTTNPDNSGNLKFLADELQDAENKGERAWVLGHVLTGWDGSNPLPNPTDLFYQIIDRYSPHVIAGVFFGHTHEDQFMIYYANNGTVQDAAHALNVGWIGPSVVPLTNLNSGYRVYEVDTGDFSVYDAYTYYTNVSAFGSLNTSETGPVWKFEYSTRDAYPIGWPKTAPLNATYWHKITEAMSANHSLVSQFNTLQGKMSVQTPNCTNTACALAKICYMRSGSVALGKQCPQGFNSVQGPFTGKNF